MELMLKGIIVEPPGLLPARLNVQQTARILGFAEHDIAPLMKSGHLKALGNPSPNAPKYFSTVSIMAIAQDSDALDKMTRAVSRHWARKNQAARGNKAETRIVDEAA